MKESAKGRFFDNLNNSGLTVSFSYLFCVLVLGHFLRKSFKTVIMTVQKIIIKNVARDPISMNWGFMESQSTRLDVPPINSFLCFTKLIYFHRIGP